MICRDEEATIFRCLREVAEFVDEIVIVDTGSTDRTKELVGHFTDKIFDFHWCDDFSAPRNYGIAKASGEWLLLLDSDEVIYRTEMQRIRAILEEIDARNDETVSGLFLEMHEYEVTYENLKPDTYIRRPSRPGQLVQKRLRLVRNGEGVRYVGSIHECLDFRTRVNRDLDSGIQYVHFRDVRRLPWKAEYYFRLEELALRNEPQNSNAHYNALRTYLLRGWQGKFEEAVSSLVYIEPRLVSRFEALQEQLTERGWSCALEMIRDLLCRVSANPAQAAGR